MDFRVRVVAGAASPDAPPDVDIPHVRGMRGLLLGGHQFVLMVALRSLFTGANAHDARIALRKRVEHLPGMSMLAYVHQTLRIQEVAKSGIDLPHIAVVLL